MLKKSSVFVAKKPFKSTGYQRQGEMHTRFL